MNYNDYHKSYVYRFDNIVNGKWYIGARWKYDCKPEDDEYDSSSSNDEFWDDLSKGLLKKTIICEFYDSNLPITVYHDGIPLVLDNVVILALWVEYQLIKSGWKKYGIKSSYNKVARFNSNIEFHNPSDNRSESAKRSYSTAVSNNGGKHPMVEASMTADVINKRLESDRNNHGGQLGFHSKDAREKAKMSRLERGTLSNCINGMLTDDAKKKNHAQYLWKDPNTGIIRSMDRGNAGKFLKGWIKLGLADQLVDELTSTTTA